MVTVSAYNAFKYDLMNGAVDLDTDTIKCALLNNSHSFSATDALWSAISANEIANGNGYTTGGKTLTNPTITSGTTVTFDGDDFAWTQATITAYYGVIYNATTGRLIASIDFDGVQSSVGCTFKIEQNAGGIITLT